VAWVLLALWHTLQSLDRFYTQPSIPADPTVPTNLACFFPHLISFPTVNGDVRFEYVIKLADENPTKAIFKAKIVGGGDRIMVKFVQMYNFAAHQLLAAHDLAPRLLYPENAADEPAIDVGSLKLAVMEFVDGVTAHDVYGHPTALPDVTFSKVEKAITILHENGFVFGDLQPPNIMVLEQGAHLVDFDWCASDGAGTYLVSLNNVDQDIGWHIDVKCGGVMDKEHDLLRCGNCGVPELVKAQVGFSLI
jgi:serine/threonine protein kinase